MREGHQSDRGYVIGPGDPVVFGVSGPGRLRVHVHVVIEEGAEIDQPVVVMQLDGASRRFPLKSEASARHPLSPAARATLFDAPLSEATSVSLDLGARTRELKLEVPRNARYRLVVAALQPTSDGTAEHTGAQPIARHDSPPDKESSLATREQRSTSREARPQEKAPKKVPEKVPEEAPGEATTTRPSASEAQATQRGGSSEESAEDFIDPLAELDLVPIAPLERGPSSTSQASRSSGGSEWVRSGPSATTSTSSSPHYSNEWAQVPSDPRGSDSPGVGVGHREQRTAQERSSRSRRTGFYQPAPGIDGSLFHQVELIPKAGYTFGRSRLAGQGLYQLEISTRLDALKLPFLRASAAMGFQPLAGAWLGNDVTGLYGRFHQSSQVIPVDVGVLVEPWHFENFAPYLGLFLNIGYTHTSLRRYSLDAEQSGGLFLAATASLGVKMRLGRLVLLAELRNSEGKAAFSDLSLAQEILSSTAILGGLGWSFR